MIDTMMPKISDARFEALEAHNQNLQADQQRMVDDMQKSRKESTDLIWQLLQNMQQFQLMVCARLDALETKEHSTLQPISSLRSE
ncbi:unnamed protein product [Spirodela intermedia]|uniref:Uncharacterized protein n=2 Tax=Spirodela intermedia TaxID=51605 RepID=A0A7I8K8G1_SPIIN|nr:unnamed protein product [Spirodela intermedia]CAA6657787.1 unnamed protein product [Spirodela intermedia]CAA7393905.1 unnamed protein product [Spirodela intermedia]